MVVHKDLHPELIYLLAQTLKEEHGGPGVFHRCRRLSDLDRPRARDGGRGARFLQERAFIVTEISTVLDDQPYEEDDRGIGGGCSRDRPIDELCPEALSIFDTFPSS